MGPWKLAVFPYAMFAILSVLPLLAIQRVLQQRQPLLKSLARLACRDRLLRMGVALRFVYTGPDGAEVAAVDVSPADCR